MTDSPGKRSHYLQSLVGSEGKAGYESRRGVATLLVKCNFCCDPNPAGGSGIKRRFAGARVRDVAVLWLEHEASPEHELAVSRARSSVTHRPPGKSLDAMLAHLTSEALAEIRARAT